MISWKNIKGHFGTIMQHKWLVGRMCMQVGLYRQGICHDLSKFTPTEFAVGVRFFQGFRSPNNAERESKGYSEAWLHHKGRNRHHYEYWIDYSVKPGVILEGSPMPLCYIVEMFIDRIAASKVYLKEAYSDASPLQYFEQGDVGDLIHPETRRMLKGLLLMLAVEGEATCFRYIRRKLRKEKRGKRR